MRKILLIALLCVAGFAGYRFFLSQLGVAEGDLAPEFSGEFVDGRHFDLAHFRGSYVLIDFWGSWCKPCRRENPHLVDFVRKYEEASFDNADGFSIVSVALEKNPANSAIAREKDGLYWENHLVEKVAAVLLSDRARAFGVSEIPTKILIGPEGQVLGKMNFNQLEAELSAHVR